LVIVIIKTMLFCFKHNVFRQNDIRTSHHKWKLKQVHLRLKVSFGIG